ncbi:MAG: NAD-binding protein [Arcobacteraceae bacterium]|jgi:voltage-gated potassium channel|nr:NAD-binding protein [Arcobacteraceae bacterium]
MVLIFGYSKLAAEIASKLQEEQYEFAIIEPIGAIRQFAIKDNYTTNIYDFECYDDKELLSLGINTDAIEIIFCVHNEFNRNLFVTLSARSLNKELRIMTLANDLNEEKKLHLAGATVCINPSETTGLRIFRQLDKPISLSIMDGILYGHSGLLVKEILILENSILDGKYSKELVELKQFNLLLLGIQDKELSHEFTFSSRGINHKLDAGDIIVILGREKEIVEFEEFLIKTQK